MSVDCCATEVTLASVLLSAITASSAEGGAAPQRDGSDFLLHFYVRPTEAPVKERTRQAGDDTSETCLSSLCDSRSHKQEMRLWIYAVVLRCPSCHCASWQGYGDVPLRKWLKTSETTTASLCWRYGNGHPRPGHVPLLQMSSIEHLVRRVDRKMPALRSADPLRNELRSWSQRSAHGDSQVPRTSCCCASKRKDPGRGKPHLRSSSMENLEQVNVENTCPLSQSLSSRT